MDCSQESGQGVRSSFSIGVNRESMPMIFADKNTLVYRKELAAPRHPSIDFQEIGAPESQY